MQERWELRRTSGLWTGLLNRRRSQPSEGGIFAGIAHQSAENSLGSDSTQGAGFEEVIEARGFTGNNKDGRADRRLVTGFTPQVARAADNVGCEPPQPIESARRGRPFLATSSFVGQQPTSRPDSLSARSGAGRPPVSGRSNQSALGAFLRLPAACLHAGARRRAPRL